MTASQTNLDRSPLPRLQDEVVDILNEHVGIVTAVFGDKFRLRTEIGDFYAPNYCIFKRDQRRLTLICDRSGVDRYFREWNG